MWSGKVLILTPVLALFSTVAPSTGPSPSVRSETPTASATDLVRSIYEMVTFEAGTTPEWNKVRELFLPEAVVVLRTGRDATKVFDVDGFIRDFMEFIKNFNAKATGFSESVVRMKPMVFGDIAHVLVLYEASIPGSPRPPQRGVDSWQLIRKQDRWWIVSVVNEIPTTEHPLPEELQEQAKGTPRKS